MEKSLYFEYVKKYFPLLVTSLVEKMNEKREGAEPKYLHRELLTKEYSADGRWASIYAEYSRVAADVVALDSELPLKSRDSLETASGDIPKIGMKLALKEKEQKLIDGMIAQGKPTAQIVAKIFADLRRCLEGVPERLEDMFLSELSTGVALSKRNNGTGIRLDVGYLTENKFGVGVKWETPATSKPLDDMQKVFDKALEDDNVITDVWMDDFALKNLYVSQQVREQFAFDNGVSIANGGNIPTLDLTKTGQVIKTKWGVNIHRIARNIKTELNGVKSNHNPWQKGMVVFTCDEKLGNLVWTDTVEQSRKVPGVQYEEAEEYILLSKYSKNDPWIEFTASQAMVVPILNNVNRIYTLDSCTVQG